MKDEIAAIAERELGAPPDGVSQPAEGLLHGTYELEVEEPLVERPVEDDRDGDRLGRFERVEPLYRVQTLAGTVAGLLELDELSEYEQEFYGERILDAIERIDRT